MKLLLRKIRRNRWVDKTTPLSDTDLAHLTPDFNLEDGKFSVYVFDNDNDFELTLIGLASNMSDLNKVEYLWVDLEDFTQAGFNLVLEEIEGTTPCEGANKLHRNIVLSDDTDLSKLIEIAINKGVTDIAFGKQIRQLLLDAIEENKVDVTKMKHGLHKDLKLQCNCAD